MSPHYALAFIWAEPLTTFIILGAVVLCVTGGIAAFKCLELIRLLKARNIRVRTIMTRAAEEFVTPLSVASLTGEKARWYPEVALFGFRELYKGGLTLLDPVWAAGVTARWTLFDGLSRERGIVAAKERVTRVDEVTKRARRDVETLVEKKYREARKAQEQVEAFEAALALARESLRVRTLGFEEGVATSLDVVDARISLARVELGKLAEARDFDVALAELLEAAGQSERFEALRASATGDVEK